MVKVNGRGVARGRLFSVLLCLLALSLCVSGCSLFGGNSPPARRLVKAPASKQILTIPQVVSDLTTLDPALVLSSDQPSMSAIQMINTGLVSLDDHLQVQPQLAQSWTISPNGLTYTFHLRHNLKFSDGTALTASDVAYSIDRALQPATKSPVAPIYLALLKDADKLLAGFIPTLVGDSLLTPDANTLVVQVRKPAAYFLDMLTYPCSYVVEKRLIDTYGTSFTDHLSEGGSSGPFKVTQYTHGQEIDFAPNSYYYGSHPQLRKVAFPFYAQAGLAYHDYLLGKLDMTGVPAATYASDKKRQDYHQVPQLWINYYTMNYKTPPFDNIHIRQAFALAIDKTALAATVWKGTVLPTNHIVPEGMPGYNAALTGPDGTQSLRGNPTQARALLQKGLKEEGWSSVSQMPPVQLTYATGQTSADAEVNALVKMWQKVLGVTVTANPIDYSALLTQVSLATGNANGLQFWGLAWVGEYPDAQDWLTRQFDSGVPDNNMNYGQNTSSDAIQQQALQQKLEAADANSNAAQRLQVYQQAEQQLVNDVAWLPVEQVTTSFLRQPTVIGMVDNAMNTIAPNDWATIYKAQYLT